MASTSPYIGRLCCKSNSRQQSRACLRSIVLIVVKSPLELIKFRRHGLRKRKRYAPLCVWTSFLLANDGAGGSCYSCGRRWQRRYCSSSPQRPQHSQQQPYQQRQKRQQPYQREQQHHCTSTAATDPAPSFSSPHRTSPYPLHRRTGTRRCSGSCARYVGRGTVSLCHAWSGVHLGVQEVAPLHAAVRLWEQLAGAAAAGAAVGAAAACAGGGAAAGPLGAGGARSCPRHYKKGQSDQARLPSIQVRWKSSPADLYQTVH